MTLFSFEYSELEKTLNLLNIESEICRPESYLNLTHNLFIWDLNSHSGKLGEQSDLGNIFFVAFTGAGYSWNYIKLYDLLFFDFCKG